MSERMDGWQRGEWATRSSPITLVERGCRGSEMGMNESFQSARGPMPQHPAQSWTRFGSILVSSALLTARHPHRASASTLYQCKHATATGHGHPPGGRGATRAYCTAEEEGAERAERGERRKGERGETGEIITSSKRSNHNQYVGATTSIAGGSCPRAQMGGRDFLLLRLHPLLLLFARTTRFGVSSIRGVTITWRRCCWALGRAQLPRLLQRRGKYRDAPR